MYPSSRQRLRPVVGVSLATIGAVMLMASTAFGAVVRQGSSTSDPIYEGQVKGTLHSATATFDANTLLGSGTISCNESLVEGDLLDAGETDDVPNGDIDSADWTQDGSQECPSTLPTTDECASSADALSWDDVTVGGSAANGYTFAIDDTGNVNVTIVCDGSLDCFYEADEIVGDIDNPTGSTPATVTFDDEVLNEDDDRSSDFGCPSSGEFSAVYALTQDDGDGGNLWVHDS